MEKRKGGNRKRGWKEQRETADKEKSERQMRWKRGEVGIGRENRKSKGKRRIRRKEKGKGERSEAKR